MINDQFLSQLKILYVEDDECTREELQKYLRKKVGKVVIAADGKEGLKKYFKEKPDIVIADILLPGLNGMEMLKRIRKEGGRTPFIITSSVGKAEIVIEAVDIGIVKYIVKPIILEQLLETLNRLAEEIGLSGALFDDVEEKHAAELKIKQSVTAFLKKAAGKGPRDMTVFIREDKIEITAFGMLSTIEKKLLEDKHNASLVEHIHKNFYKVSQEELEYTIAQITGMEIRLLSTDFAVFKAMDTLLFQMSHS